MYQGIAAAKINLTLQVQGRRPDGYHLLESVMQSLSLCDIVEVSEAEQTSLCCDWPNLACDRENLAWRAWELMQREFSLSGGIQIKLHKQIPLGGGLAGGSSDAAQVLLAVNDIYKLNLTPERLISLAVQLGADVPFCLFGGTLLAQGVGEKLQSLAVCPELRLVLVNPGFEVDTKAVYKQYDKNKLNSVITETNENAAEKMLQALQAGNPVQIRAALCNDLEVPSFQLFPKLAAIKAEMTGLGLASLLCGSGATVFGIATDKKRAAVAAEALRGKYPFVCAVTTRN